MSRTNPQDVPGLQCRDLTGGQPLWPGRRPAKDRVGEILTRPRALHRGVGWVGQKQAADRGPCHLLLRDGLEGVLDFALALDLGVHPEASLVVLNLADLALRLRYARPDLLPAL